MDYKKLKLSDLQEEMIVLCKSRHSTNRFIGKIIDISEITIHLERISLIDFSVENTVTIVKESWDFYDMSSLDDFASALRELFPLKDVLDCFFDTSKKETTEEMPVKEDSSVPFCWEYYQLDTKGYELFTRTGLPVRIIYYGAKGNHPIVALIDEGKEEVTITYDNYGTSDDWDPDYYLLMRKIVKKKYAGVYTKEDGTIYTTAFVDNVSDIKDIPGSTLVKIVDIDL